MSNNWSVKHVQNMFKIFTRGDLQSRFRIFLTACRLCATIKIIFILLVTDLINFSNSMCSTKISYITKMTLTLFNLNFGNLLNLDFGTILNLNFRTLLNYKVTFLTLKIHTPKIINIQKCFLTHFKILVFLYPPQNMKNQNFQRT